MVLLRLFYCVHCVQALSLYNCKIMMQLLISSPLLESDASTCRFALVQTSASSLRCEAFKHLIWCCDANIKVTNVIISSIA
jgi:hypothetical protein